MSYNLVITPSFARDAKYMFKKHKSLKTDLTALFKSLESEPMQGKMLGKDCYKIRIAIRSKGKGKSGGARVIICIKVTENNVFLPTIYDKSEKDTLTDKELNDLLGHIY
jgi:hypothetical protein